MRLKNKNTGEIIEAVIVDHGDEWEIRNAYNHEDTQIYSSLTVLNAEWGDAPEEPKNNRTWFLDFSDGPDFVAYGDNPITDPCYDDWNELGICFETKEEAEKAVEKLKALKRLKDKGFRVIDYGDEDIRYEIKDRYDGCLFDLETVLFGGEE